MSNDEKEDAIFRVETVPPPGGDGDAYNSPTKVGPMAAAVIKEMMVASERKVDELTARARAAASESRESATPAPPATPTEATPEAAPKDAPEETTDALAAAEAESRAAPEAPDAPAAEPEPAAIAKAYDDIDEDNVGTMMSPLAKPPLVEQVEARRGDVAVLGELTSGDVPSPLGAPDLAQGRGLGKGALALLRSDPPMAILILIAVIGGLLWVVMSVYGR